MAGDCASGRAGCGGLVEAGWNRGNHVLLHHSRSIFSLKRRLYMIHQMISFFSSLASVSTLFLPTSSPAKRRPPKLEIKIPENARFNAHGYSICTDGCRPDPPHST